MKLRRAFDLFMVFIAGPLGLPYVFVMIRGTIRVLVKQRGLGTAESISEPLFLI